MPGSSNMSSDSSSSSSNPPSIPLQMKWANTSESMKNSRAQYHSHKPFPLICIDDFVNNEFLNTLESELENLMFHVKENDLFSFLQSDDLAVQHRSPAIQSFTRSLYSKTFRSALSQLSDIDIDDRIDLTSSVYQQTNHLLCHDDELLDRRLAFILYIVCTDWTTCDGGSLDLFECNDVNEPITLVKSIVPKRNSLVVFEVSPYSYHQVSEVLSGDKTRITIGGWFHGQQRNNIAKHSPIIHRQLSMKPISFATATGSCSETDFSALGEWVCANYLESQSLKVVKQQLLDDSCVELINFLLPHRLEQVMHALRSEQQYTRVGPYNKRCYEEPEHGKLTSTIQSLLNEVMMSDAMVRYLCMLSGGVAITARGAELRRMSAGCYTLAFDDNPETQECALDVVLCLADDDDDDNNNNNNNKDNDDSGWANESSGGALVYVDEDATEPLITVAARCNSLVIVYRAEPGTMRFTKYISRAAPGVRYDISMICRVITNEECESDNIDDDDDDDDDDE